MLAVDKDAIGSLELFEALERLLAEYGILTLSRETIAIQRLVIAESDRIPELAATFYAEAIRTTQALLAEFLVRECALGSIELDDPYSAGGMLRGMMIRHDRTSRYPKRDRNRAASPSLRSHVFARVLDGSR